MKFHAISSYFIPEGIWLIRTIVIFSFIFLDYLVTTIYCKHPNAEGNIYARSFMQDYGIAAGLAVFDLMMAVPLYAILCLDSYLVRLSKEHSAITELLTDVGLGWLVAGAHFDGALSWFLGAQSIISQAIGLIVYETITIPLFIHSRKPLFSRLGNSMFHVVKNFS